MDEAIENAADDAKSEGKKPNAAIDNLLKTVGLNWIRPLVYKLGGRKVLMGGGGLAIINEVVKSDVTDTGKIIVSICCAVIAVGTAISIAIEDGKKGTTETKETKPPE